MSLSCWKYILNVTSVAVFQFVKYLLFHIGIAGHMSGQTILMFFVFVFNYPPSSGIASCVGTAGMVTWCLHLTRPCCVALEQVLIWVVSLEWLNEVHFRRGKLHEQTKSKLFISHVTKVQNTKFSNWQRCNILMCRLCFHIIKCVPFLSLF